MHPRYGSCESWDGVSLIFEELCHECSAAVLVDSVFHVGAVESVESVEEIIKGGRFGAEEGGDGRWELVFENTVE